MIVARAFLVALGVTLLAAPIGLRAQGLLDASRIACNFQTVSSNDGPFDPYSFSVESELFSMIFIREGDQYYILSDIGRVEVSPSVVPRGGLVLFERVPTGTYQVTAIDVDLNAVHSRHTFLLAPTFRGEPPKLDLAPSQYYGSCQLQ